MGRDTARTTQPDDAIDLRRRSAGRSTRRPDLCLMSPAPQRTTAAAALGLGPDPCSADLLADYYQLRRAVPADYAMLEEAARAGEPASVGLALHVLLPGMLRWRPRESLLAELAALVGEDGPAPGAAQWAVRMAENEAFRRYVGDRMLDSVTVEWVPAEMRLRFIMAGVILDDPGDGTVDLVALDPVSSVPFAAVLLDEIAAAEQLVAIEDLARRAVLATDTALPIAVQLLTSPERFSLNDAEQFRSNVVAVADLAAPAIAQLHPSNHDQLARLTTAQSQLEAVRGATESGWKGIQAFQRAHSPDETAGELYDWAAEEQYRQGGLHYISGGAYDVWHFFGEVTTFGSMGRRADNARAYREGRISYDAYEENERWDLLASAVTAIITGLSLGLGARLAAGRFAISAGYTPVGSAVLSGTVAGGTGAAADAMAQDAAALLASHATDNPYVAAYQRSRIGGPAGWLQSGLVGAMAGGFFGGLFAKLASIFGRRGPAIPPVRPAVQTRIRPVNGRINVGGGHEPGAQGASNLNPMTPGTGGPSRAIPNHVSGAFEEIAERFVHGSAKLVYSNRLPFGTVDWTRAAQGAFKVLAPGGRVSLNIHLAGRAEHEVVMAALRAAGFKNVVVELGQLVVGVKP